MVVDGCIAGEGTISKGSVGGGAKTYHTHTNTILPRSANWRSNTCYVVEATAGLGKVTDYGKRIALHGGECFLSVHFPKKRTKEKDTNKANRKFSFYAIPALHKLENLRFAPLLDRLRTTWYYSFRITNFLFTRWLLLVMLQ